MRIFGFAAINRIVSAIILLVFMLSLEPSVVAVYAEGILNSRQEIEQRRLPELPAQPPVEAQKPLAEPATVMAEEAQRAEPSAVTTAKAEPQVLARVVARITPESGGTIELGAMKLEIPAQAITTAMDISLEELGSVEALNSGLANSTKRVAGYRALPHGTQFQKFVKISVPYDKTVVDTPAKRDALSAYFYDESRKVWTKLDRIGLDEEKGVLESVTTHFTDFITATLKLPDSPKPLGFNPTSIKDIKAADPSAGIPQVEGLEPNQSGSASFQIPLRLPAGRAGLAPQLAIAYNSSGSSGWLGQGFDLSVPSISIDTRKHLATYDDATEIYSWAGQELVLVSKVGEVATFRPRVEGGFAKIIRQPATGHALSADDHQYMWEVQEKNGRTTTFGGEIGAVNGKDTSHDFQWMVSRIEDANGNWMHYSYTKDTRHLYVDTIDYTLHGASNSGNYYRVKFNNETRPDRRSEMRGGFINKLAQRLKSIDVGFVDAQGQFKAIRRYGLEYGYSTFGKSQITAISELSGDQAHQFYKYSFDYFNVDKLGDKVIGLKDPDAVNWEGSAQETFSANINGGGSLSGGVDIYFPYPVLDVFSVNAGVNITGGSSSTYENVAVFDINGDGLPDQIQHNMSKNQRILLGNGQGGYTTAALSNFPNEIWSWINGTSSTQSNLDIGVFGDMSIVEIPVLSAAYTHSTNSSDSKWSYLDIDGDGLVDIVKPGIDHYYRNISRGGDVAFESRSYNGTAGKATAEAPSDDMLERSHLLDPLRMWMAQWRGNIALNAKAEAKNKPSDWDGVSINAYMVRGTAEAQNIGSAQLGPQNPTATISQSLAGVNPGDHVVLQQSSGLLTKDDTIDWNAAIHYTQAAVFGDFTNPRYAVLPQSYVTAGTIPFADATLLLNYYTTEEVTDATAPRIWTLMANPPAASERIQQYFIDRNYYINQRLSQEEFVAYCKKEKAYDTASGAEPFLAGGKVYKYDPLLDKLVLTDSSAAAVLRLYIIMHYDDGTAVTVTQSKQLPVVDESQSVIDPYSGLVVSKQVRQVATNTIVGTTGYVDDRDALQRPRVLVETIQHLDHSQTSVYLRPYIDGLGTLHVQAETEGTITGPFPADRWIDGTPLAITVGGSKPNYQFTVTGSYLGHDQAKLFSLSYTPTADIDNNTVIAQLTASKLQDTLTDGQYQNIQQAMDDLALNNAQKRFAACYNLLTDGSGNYALVDPTPAADEQAFVLWAEVLGGVVDIPGARATALAAQFTSSFSETTPGQFSKNSGADNALVLWAEILGGVVTVSGITANFLTGDFTDKTDPANPVAVNQADFLASHPGLQANSLISSEFTQVVAALRNHYIEVQVATDDYRDGTDPTNVLIKNQAQILSENPQKLPPTLSGTNVNIVKNALAVNKTLLKESMDLKARLSRLFVHDASPAQTTVLDTSGLDADATLSAQHFVLWWEITTSIVQVSYLTQKADYDFSVESGNETNPAVLFYLPSYNLFTFTGVGETISCNSETLFNVQSVMAHGTINEYNFGARAVEGPTDAIILSHFVGNATVEEPVYIHPFDSQQDLALKKGFDIRSNIRFNDPSGVDGSAVTIPQSNIITNFSGGGYNWFYAEWNGYAPNQALSTYDEAKIRNQNDILNYREEDKDHVKYSVEARRNCQVIWALKWEPEKCGETWHGSIYTKQTTEWDGHATSLHTYIYYSYIGSSSTTSFRLGGDDSVASTNETIEAGSALSWVRRSTGYMDTTNLGTLGAASVAYAKGASDATYDIADLNGDRFPDMIKQSGSDILVYMNQGKSLDGDITDSTAAPSVSFGDATPYRGLGSFRTFANSGISFSASVSSGTSQVIRAIVAASGKAKDVSLDGSSSSKPSLSAGLGVNVGASFKKSDLIDINGDGLPDLVSRSGNTINVKVNNGNGFTAGQTIDCAAESPYINTAIDSRYGGITSDATIRNAVVGSATSDLLSFSGNTSGSINASIGGSVGGLGLSAGVGISVSTDRGYFDLMDLNGDGLPDLVMKEGSKLKVAFNQGDQFTTPVEWGSRSSADISLTDLQVYNPTSNQLEPVKVEVISGLEGQSKVASPLLLGEEISSSTTLGFSANGSLQIPITFPIFAWVVPIIFTPGMITGKIGIGCSIGGGVNVTTIENSYSDMDGDGLPDSVMKTSNGMRVRLNNTGKDGLLKTIKLPQGGEIALDYDLSHFNPADPSRRMELISVTRNDWTTAQDNVASDKPSAALPDVSLVNTFAYSKGYYSRNDRSFWGYGQVTSQRMNGQLVASTQISTYDNENYYLKDKPYRIETFDANNAPVSTQTTVFTPIFKAAKSYWIRTDSQSSVTYADGRELSSKTIYKDYDDLGDPQVIEEYQNTLQHIINITYDSPRQSGISWLAGLPTALKVFDADNKTLLRYRTGHYDAQGNLDSQSSYWTGNANDCLTTTFSYDSYGNLLTETDNTNYQLTYQYDDVVNSYVVKVSDNTQPTSQTTAWSYDYAQGGLELAQQDTNGKVIRKDYDAFGRMTNVWSPYDTGTTPALHFEYQLASLPWKAITYNKVDYEATDAQTIATVVLVNGQGQMLQTKKQTVITDPATKARIPGWNVSPWVVVDQQGREYQKGMPTFDADPSNTGLYLPPIRTEFGGTDLYTQNTYDARDRVVQVRLPDGNLQKTTYELAIWNNQSSWCITSIDPDNKVKRSWLDGNQTILAVVQDPNGRNLVSQFVYDGIGQMVRASDADGNSTSVVYDVLGRKQSINNPDSGLVNFVYDQYGDMVQKIDPVLRLKNLSINYRYDHHRMMQITYPDSTTVYTYGSDPAANNVGRLIATDNGSVIARTTYGPMGEVLSVQRVIASKQANRPAYDNTMQYAYNYLGQMTKITYPANPYQPGDAPETVSYHYDGGGQIESITGTFLGQQVTYASNIGYDEFGQRITLSFGNGTTTNYVYDPARRWLKSLSTVKDLGGEGLQNLEYTFYSNGDVKTFKDSSTYKSYQQSYTYDSLDQLIGAAGSFSNTHYTVTQTANYTQTFKYEGKVGNLTAKISTLNRYPAKAEDKKLNYALNYSYDPSHPHQATQVGDIHYQYDANGNLTSMIPDWEWNDGKGPVLSTVTVTHIGEGQDVTSPALGSNRGSTNSMLSGTRSMTWDYENRLVGAQDGQMTVAYTYDADGERRLKVQGTAENVYVDRMYEIDNGSSNPVASVHVYLGDTRLVSKLTVLTNPNYLTEEQNTFYYHADQLGSSSLITDRYGQEYERMAFTPHGEVWQHDSLDTLDSIDLLFTGKAMDSETGWYYFGARYLNPQTGMWLSGDPALADYLPRAALTDDDRKANNNLPGMGGIYNPVNFALYHYAGNNPVKYTDPDGRETVKNVMILVLRQSGSYSPSQDRNNPTNVAMDRMIIITTSSETFIQGVAKFFGGDMSAIKITELKGLQSVANYPSTDASGKAGPNYLGNTIASGQTILMRAFASESSVAEGPVMELTNAKTMDGQWIGTNATTPTDSARWLEHSNRGKGKTANYNTPYSKGCFIFKDWANTKAFENLLKQYDVKPGDLIPTRVKDE